MRRVKGEEKVMGSRLAGDTQQARPAGLLILPALLTCRFRPEDLLPRALASRGPAGSSATADEKRKGRKGTLAW